MAAIYHGAARVFEYQCDWCRSASFVRTRGELERGLPDPPGWDRDNDPGGSHHYCPTCRFREIVAE